MADGWSSDYEGVADLMRQVAHDHKLGLGVILSRIRTHPVAMARRELMYLLHTEMNLSFSHISRILNLDHTTVSYAVKKYQTCHSLRQHA